MAKITLEKAHFIVARLAKCAKIETIAARTHRFTESEIRRVYSKNGFPDDPEYTDAWNLMRSKRKVGMVREHLLARSLEDHEIEDIFKRRLQGETYAAIEDRYHAVAVGYVGNLCSPQNGRGLSPKLKKLWDEIQERREELDNRRHLKPLKDDLRR